MRAATWVFTHRIPVRLLYTILYRVAKNVGRLGGLDWFVPGRIGLDQFDRRFDPSAGLDLAFSAVQPGRSAGL